MTKKYMETIARYGNLGVSPAEIKGVSGVSVTRNVQKHAFMGDILQHNFANISESPSATFNTTDLKIILDATDIDPVAFSSTNQIEFNWREMTDGGTFVGGGTDEQKIITHGYMFPNSISCSHNEVAQISVNCVGLYDGTNDPLSESSTATAPAEVTEDYAYTLSAMKFGSAGSSTIPIQSINVDFGIQTEAVGSDGSLYPTELYVTGRRANITIGTNSLGFDKLYSKGAIDTTDDLILYFARLKEGGSRYADNTSQHIKITISGHIMSSPGGIGDTANIEITPVWDGSNPLYSTNTTSTIT